MSKEIDFEFGRSIGATHYVEVVTFPWHKVVGDTVSYWRPCVQEWVAYISTGWGREILKESVETLPLEQWTIYNNTLPLRELSDEQAAQLFNAWIRGEQRIAMEPNDEIAVCNNSWYKDAVYRIKPKSERDEFVEKCMSAAGQEPMITGMGFKDAYAAIFDAIQRGGIKAPEVVK